MRDGTGSNPPVTCPACGRLVKLNLFGALDTDRRPVMNYHFTAPGVFKECPGSSRSVEATRLKIAATSTDHGK